MFQSNDNNQQSAQDEPVVTPTNDSANADESAVPNQDDTKSDDLPMPGVADDALPKQDEKDEAEPPAITSTNSSPSAFTPSTDVPEHGSQDLDELKKQALGSLSPLVDKLDQSPEEKFNTTMMLIQSNDNKDLLPKAYEAAQAIPDEAVKAQALLDVVNEINYFSKPQEEDK